jgi:PAS domain S-box-containing protein
VLGTEAEALVGKPLVDLFDLHDASETSRANLAVPPVHAIGLQGTGRARRDAEERWWSISGRPVYDSFNNFIGFRGAGTDLTERKRSQEEVSRLATSIR